MPEDNAETTDASCLEIQNTEVETNQDLEKTQKFVNFPLGRIKQIIKLDPDVSMVSSDAVFLITKASEMFIEFLSRDAYTYTSSAKKKTVQKRDIDAAISGLEPLFFLEGAVEN